jgi:hypothetical protein
VKRWRAPRNPLVFICLIGAVIALGFTVIAAIRVSADLQGPFEEWPITIRTFSWGLSTVANVVAAVVLARAAIYRGSLSYELDRNGIYIKQLGRSYTIPLDQVIRVVPGDQAGQLTKPLITFGRGRSGQLLIVETYRYVYRLALAERNHFGREIQERRQLGVVQAQSEGLTRARQTLFDFFTAAAIQRLLVATLLLNLLLWALLTWRFPTLPSTVPVRFDPLGGTAGTRAKTYTLLLPAIATAAWLGNLVLALVTHQRSRLLSELLLLGALIVQIVLLLAAWFIITLAV